MSDIKCCTACAYNHVHNHLEPCKSCDTKLSTFFPVEKVAEKPEMVNHPAHYQGANECIDVMVGMFGTQAVIDFCRCNAYKYRFRADMKNGEEDIKKAEWYETKMLEMQGLKP